MEDDLEQAFKKLEKAGRNSVDNLLNFMKDAKIIEKTNEAEQQARDLFSNVQNQEKVALGKFQEVVEILAQNKEVLEAKVEKVMGKFFDSFSQENVKFEQSVETTTKSAAESAMKAVADVLNSPELNKVLETASKSVADIVNSISKK